MNNQNQPSVLPQSTLPPAKPSRFFLKSWPRKKLLIGVITAVAALVVAVVAMFFWRHLNQPKQPKVDKNGVTILQQSFTKVTKFTVVGAADGTSVIFNLPAEFGTASSEKGHASFTGYTSNRSFQTVPLAELAISSYPMQQPFSAADLAYLNKNMSVASFNKSTAQQMQGYTSKNIDSGYGLKVGTVKAFTNPNIKANAWVVDVTATPKNTKSSTLSQQQGVVIYAIGEKAQYYFTFMATDYNWNNSQNALRAILNSLKIDQ